MGWPLLLSLCAAFLTSRAAQVSGTVRQIYEFPNGTWVENLAFRANGQLLVTIVTEPSVYQIDPAGQSSAPKRVAHFADSLAVLGITEMEEDVFAVVRGNFSITGPSYTPGSFFISKIDLRSQDDPTITTIAPVPEGQLLNGITTVEQGSKYLLIADSEAGVIWRLNTEDSQVDCVLNTTATQPAMPFAQGGLGLNGIRVFLGQAYFTNTNRGFYSVPIHTDGTPAGDVVELASFAAGDDFALASSGTAYIARGAVDKIEEVTSSGMVTALSYSNASAPQLIEGNTAVAFGRTKRDENTLYVTTNGGISGLIEGTVPHGGRVLAIDLK